MTRLSLCCWCHDPIRLGAVVVFSRSHQYCSDCWDDGAGGVEPDCECRRRPPVWEVAS